MFQRCNAVHRQTDANFLFSAQSWHFIINIRDRVASGNTCYFTQSMRVARNLKYFKICSSITIILTSILLNNVGNDNEYNL